MPEVSLSAILSAGFYAGGAERAIDFEGHWYDCDWFRAVGDGISNAISSANLTSRTAIAVIPRNRPAIAAALVTLLVKEHPVRMIYAFQSPDGKVRDIRALRPAVIIADETDWDEQIIAAAREIGSQVISLRTTTDAKSVVTVRSAPDTGRLALHEAPLAASGVELLTSGTTGSPKRVFISTEVLTSIAGEQFVSVGATQIQQEKPVTLIFPPFGNVAGLYALLPAAAGRRPFALLDKFSVSGWCAAIERNAVKAAGIPPAGLRMILEQNVPPQRLKSLENVYSGAAPLEAEVQDAFEAKYGIPVLLSYGATEFGGPVATTTPAIRREWGPAKRHSVGLPFGASQLRIVAPSTGQPVPPGTEGLLEVISPRVSSEWLRTSDLAVMDSDGFLYLKGRADRVINRGGFKVSPELIADALGKHPSVAAAAAVAIPDARLGQVPVAAVELKPSAQPATEAQLMAHARSHLYAMLVPTRIRILPELPRNPSFKVDLAALERLFTQEEPTAGLEETSA